MKADTCSSPSSKKDFCIKFTFLSCLRRLAAPDSAYIANELITVSITTLGGESDYFKCQYCTVLYFVAILIYEDI